MKPDRTWAMHMCVCASIIVTFVLVLFGLTSYNDLVRLQFVHGIIQVFKWSKSILLARPAIELCETSGKSTGYQMLT